MYIRTLCMYTYTHKILPFCWEFVTSSTGVASTMVGSDDVDEVVCFTTGLTAVVVTLLVGNNIGKGRFGVP